jgi:chemotaxis protein methyltransferase CheR
MTCARAADELNDVRAAIEATTGLAFTPDRSAALDAAMRERMRATGERELASYRLLLSPRSAEAAELGRLLTVHETYFFRNVEQLEAARAHLAARSSGSPSARPRVLSVGCSTGDEPYSLAMLLRETPELAGADIKIDALDLDHEVIANARRAHYSSWALRELPARFRARHFEQSGHRYALAADIRAMVTFAESNLLDPDARFFTPGTYDVVFCRNVLMYFSAEAARRAVASIAAALVPGGLLFLGHAETLRGLSTEFDLRQSHRAFYYQRRTTADISPDVRYRTPRPGEHTLPADGLAAAASGTERYAWFGAIARSAARVRALAAPSAADVGLTVKCAGTPSAAADDVRLRTLELIRAERFAAALETLEPADDDWHAPDPDSLLLKALLLTCGGEPLAAEATCGELLALDDAHAGAHYVLALCREHGGDSAGAIDHDRAAIYLDPGFAMPHLHLGRLLRRHGEHRAARSTLEAAATLLERDDPARIELFGGGFTREGLIELCRMELRACASMR